LTGNEPSGELHHSPCSQAPSHLIHEFANNCLESKMRGGSRARYHGCWAGFSQSQVGESQHWHKHCPRWAGCLIFPHSLTPAFSLNAPVRPLTNIPGSNRPAPNSNRNSKIRRLCLLPSIPIRNPFYSKTKNPRARRLVNMIHIRIPSYPPLVTHAQESGCLQ